MTDYLKNYIKEYLALIDLEMINKGKGAFDNVATSVVRCTDGITRTQ